MVDLEPPVDLSEQPEKRSFPWVALIAIVIGFAIAALWIVRAKATRDTEAVAAAAADQELAAAKSAVDLEREKVIDMTRQLDSLKQAIAEQQVPNKAKAVADYNKLAAEQVAQREKVKVLAAEYNQKLTKYQSEHPE